MTETLGILGFLSIFHVIGGIAIGSAVRHVIRGQIGCNTPFNIIWGLIFGAAPLFIGFTQFVSHGAIVLVLLEVGIFLGTIIVTALIPDWYIESFNVPTIGSIAFGGLFLLVGIAAGILLASNSEPLYAIIFFGAFAGSGGLIFISGLNTLLKQ